MLTGGDGRRFNGTGISCMSVDAAHRQRSDDEEHPGRRRLECSDRKGAGREHDERPRRCRHHAEHIESRSTVRGSNRPSYERSSHAWVVALSGAAAASGAAAGRRSTSRRHTSPSTAAPPRVPVYWAPSRLVAQAGLSEPRQMGVRPAALMGELVAPGVGGRADDDREDDAGGRPHPAASVLCRPAPDADQPAGSTGGGASRQPRRKPDSPSCRGTRSSSHSPSPKTRQALTIPGGACVNAYVIPTAASG